MRNTPSRSFWGCLVLLVFASTDASAQTSDEARAAARNLASEGLRAFQTGNDKEALDRFTRAESLVHAPPHLLYLARASVRLGKLVQAKEFYIRIVREELAPSSPKAFVEAQKAAATEMAALELRVPLLTVVVEGDAAATATVTMDGVEIPHALVGVASPANPGAHTLHATTEGWADVEAKVQLHEGARETTTLTFTKAVPIASKDSKDKPSTLKTMAPWIAFGVGAVGLGVGTVFLLNNRGDRGDADALCPNGHCPAASRNDVQALDSSADSAATIAWIGYGVAAAGAITGATLLYLRRHPKSPHPNPTTGLTVVPWMSGTAGGLTGSF